MSTIRPDKGSYLTGKFLIATPAMGDPRFERTVIYVCSHDADQAMGLIVNRTHDGVNLTALLKQLEISGEINPKCDERIILRGGPVETERGFVIHSAEYCDEASSLVVSDDIIVSNTKGILSAIASENPPQNSILALGYAGWSAGQLEDEILANAWLVASADEAIIYGQDVDRKWAQALAILGIKPESLSGLSGRA